MTKFKQPKKNKRKPRSLDGLLAGTTPDRKVKSADGTDIAYKQHTGRVNPESSFQRRRNPQVARSASDNSSRLEGMLKQKKTSHLLDEAETTDQEHFNSENPNQNTEKQSTGFAVGLSKPARSLKLRRGDKDSKTHKKSRRKKVKRAILFTCLILLLGFGAFAGYTILKTFGIFRGNGEGAVALNENVQPEELSGEGDGRVNILLLGRGGEGHEAPDLTDTILLASIDPIKKTTALVSVPRDLYVLNQDGLRMKINAVFATEKEKRIEEGWSVDGAEQAGADAIEDKVSEVLGVPIHYYTLVDFTAFEDAVNTVGGIEIDVQERLVDQSIAHELNGNPVVAEEGLQTFDGRRALFYARSRKGSDRGDFDRTARQQEVLVALQQKVLSLGTFSNPFKVLELMNNLGEHVRTDLNGVGEMRRLYEIGAEINTDDMQKIGLADPPNILVDTDFYGDQSVVVPVAGLDNYQEIQSFIRNSIKDPFLVKENARIVILNGTEVVGLAAATEAELKSYGYNVVSVANAPTDDYVRNKLIDNTSGQNPFTQSYLERRLGLNSTSSQIPGLPTAEEADFVIILGTDEVNQ